MANTWQSPVDKAVEASYEHPRNYVSCMRDLGYGHPIWHFRGRRCIEFSVGDMGFSSQDEWYPAHINILRAPPSIFSVTQVSPKIQHFPASIERTEGVIAPFELISPQSAATELPLSSDTESLQCVLGSLFPLSPVSLTQITEARLLESLPMLTMILLTCTSPSGNLSLAVSFSCSLTHHSRCQWNLQVDGQAAMLYLPGGAYRSYIESTAELRRYLDSNWDAMYHFAYTKYRLQLPKDEFCCVLGLVMAPRWAAVSVKGQGKVQIFTRCAEHAEVSVEGEGVDLTYQYRAEPTFNRVLAHKFHPDKRTRPMSDYVLFANFYQIKKRPLFGRWKMKASAEPQDPNADDEQDHTPGIMSGGRADKGRPDSIPQVCIRFAHTQSL